MDLNLQTLKSKFSQLESDLNLFEMKISNVRFWQYIRNSIFNQIGLKLGIIEESHFTETKKTRYLKAIFKDIKSIFNHRSALFQNKKDVDVLIFNHPRRKLINGKYWAIYTDYLIDHSDFRYQIIEVPSFTHGWSPPKNKKTRYLDYWIFALKYVVARFSYFKISKNDLLKIKSIEGGIENKFDVKIDVKGELIKALSKRKAYISIFTGLISKLKPKLIIEVVGYTIQNMALNELCKLKNIPTVEFQHGTINSFHLGYDYPENVEVEVFPSYFFSFGNFWTQNVKLPISSERIIPVGFPYFESNFSQFKKQEKKSDTILFISQGSIGNELSKLAVEYSKLTDKKIIFKLHPGEYLRWKKEPYFTNIENIRVIDDNIIPLYQLFQECFIVVGVYSTALFEALMFNNYVLIYNLPPYLHIKELIERGMAELISNAQQLHEKIEMFSKQPNSIKVQRDDIFKLNSIENQVNAVKKILSSISSE